MTIITQLFKVSFLCVAMLHCYAISLCQQDTSIYKTYGGLFHDEFNSALFDNDSNLIFCGVTSSLDGFGSKAYMVKTDSLLNEIWSITYGDVGNSAFNDIIQKEDGYLVTGELLNPNSSYDIFLAYFDENGTLIWDKNYGSNDWDFGESISSIDGGYLISGKTYGTSNNADGYLIKVDTDGDLVWEKTFDSGGDEYFYDARESYDGNYILGGTKEISDTYSTQWLLVTDSNGDIILEKEFGEENVNIVYSVESDPLEETYYLLGEFYNSENESTDANIMRIDPAGAVVWVDTFNAVGYQKWYNLELGRFTELVCTGYTLDGDFGNEGSDILMKRITRSGNFIFQKSFGTSGDEIGLHGMRISNGYILTGHTNGLGQGQKDAFIIRTRDDGQDANYSILECVQEEFNQVTSLPGLSSSINSYYYNGFYISSAEGVLTNIYNSNGVLVHSFISKRDPEELDLSFGMYFIQALGEKTVRIVVEN